MKILSNLNSSDNVIEGTLNKYFTESKVLAVPLVGFSSVNSAVTTSDSIVLGISKLQGQISNVIVNFINIDGSSNQTTGNIKIGVGFGLYESVNGSSLLLNAIVSVETTNQFKLLNHGTAGVALLDLSFLTNTNTYKLPQKTGAQTFAMLSDLSGTNVFSADIPVVLSGSKTWGRWSNGQTIPAIGKTPNQVIIEAVTEFLIPTFTSLNITGQPLQIESGSSIAAGDKAFTWSTNNSSNITTNSIVIKNQTTNTTLVSGSANDGSESISILSIVLNGETSQVFRIIGTDTQNVIFQRDLIVSSYFMIFWGPSSTIPNNSSSARLLSLNKLRISGGNDILYTGTTQVNFIIILPPGKTISNVTDLDNVNANITADYVLQAGTIVVQDGGGTGTNRSCNIYVKTTTVPYPINTRHQFTYN